MFGSRKSKYGKAKTHFTGSITVEAAFVMPIVILSIFALLYLAFYLHDICRIQAVMDLTLHKAGMTVKHEANIESGKVLYSRIGNRGVFSILLGNAEDEEEKIQKYLEHELSEGLFLMTVKSTNVKVSKLKIKISAETNTKVTLPGIAYLFDSYSKTVLMGEYPVHNPVETIRCTEVILKTGSKINGVDKIRSKIKDIFGE